MQKDAPTTVWAAVRPQFGAVGDGGKYLADCGGVVPVDKEMEGILKEGPWFAKPAFDEVAEEKLWRESFEAVGLEEEEEEEEKET